MFALWEQDFFGYVFRGMCLTLENEKIENINKFYTILLYIWISFTNVNTNMYSNSYGISNDYFKIKNVKYLKMESKTSNEINFKKGIGTKCKDKIFINNI